MKNVFLLLCVLVLQQRIKAQFNDSTHYRVGGSTTGIYNKTNSSSSWVWSNALRLNMKRKDVTVNSSSSYIYGKQAQNVTNNDFTSALDFNLYKTFPHFYYWGLANYDHSLSLKINSRIQSGLGVAYNFVDKPDAFFNISEGILYESSDLKLADGSSDKYNTFRNSFRLRYRWAIKEIIVFDGTNFFQNSMKDGNDYMIKAINSVSVKLRKWLSFTAAVNYNKMQRTKSDNLFITFGLSAEQYF